jgi:curved DNA-binding protein CbpA
MVEEGRPDYYEILQISSAAEPETVHRVYRLLAQRFHPDNQESGNDRRFRELTEAYQTISDPEKRAEYDVAYARQQQQRWKLVETGSDPDNDFNAEQALRLTMLEVLYTRRRMEPDSPTVTPLDLESLIGRPREHLEFPTWYLLQRKLVTRSDNSALTITAEGVDYLEQHYQRVPQRRRLT